MARAKEIGTNNQKSGNCFKNRVGTEICIGWWKILISNYVAYIVTYQRMYVSANSFWMAP